MESRCLATQRRTWISEFQYFGAIIKIVWAAFGKLIANKPYLLLHHIRQSNFACVRKITVAVAMTNPAIICKLDFHSERRPLNTRLGQWICDYFVLLDFPFSFRQKRFFSALCVASSEWTCWEWFAAIFVSAFIAYEICWFVYRGRRIWLHSFHFAPFRAYQEFIFFGRFGDPFYRIKMRHASYYMYVSRILICKTRKCES